MLTLLDGVGWDGVPVPGERSHRLLAVLVADFPRAVSVEGLVERLWPDGQPDHPDKALQVLVSRTRSRTSPDAVVRSGAGYRLGLRADQVDALKLLDCVRDARAARAAGDLDVLRYAARDALAVPVTTSEGQGDPLGDLATTARAHLDEARRLLGSALLARGETEEALRLLEPALALRPDDEELVAEVLQAEAEERGVPAALQRYAAHVEHTLEVSGAEPGERLRRLHAELLARDAPVREGLRYDATPLVGRDEDVTRLRALLTEHRVVSIVGAGGLGKTRLVHLLGRLARQPVVYLVELAGVTTGDGVLRKVAADLGVRDTLESRTAQTRVTDLTARVAQRLATAPTLLVLDNCEHVLDAAADLVSYLVATTDLASVLTTSRAPLGIAAEQVYALGQLEVGESVELFARRARAARPGVRLDDGEVRELVGRLDGLPLAVELAAAKVRAMPVAEISRRLEDRFALLAGGDRSAPDRHRTLEAVIDWSWRLLRAEDQRALARLAVFPDGFAAAGAEALLGEDPFPSLAELADQSLAVVQERDDGTVRYRFLETVREYGLQQLDRREDRADSERALAAWAASTARDLERRLFTPAQPEVMTQVRAEVGNLAGTMRAGLDRRDPVAWVPLVALLVDFWSVAGEHLTVMGVLGSVLDGLEDVTEDQLASGAVDRDQVRAVLSTMAFNEALFTGQVRPAALDRLRSLGRGPGGRASAMAVLVLTMFGESEGPDVAAIERLGSDPDPAVARNALQWLSHVQENLGDVVEARESGLRALAMCDDSEGPWLRGQQESMLAGLAMQTGSWAECVGHATAALAVMRRVGAVQDVLQLEATLGLADIALGRLAEAGERLRRVAAHPISQTTLGWSAGEVGLAELSLAEGEVDQGLAFYRAAMVTAHSRPLVAQVDVDEEITPWRLFAQSSALYAHVVHGRPQMAADVAADLRAKTDRILEPVAGTIDYPVAGCVLLALGAYDLVTGADTDRAVRALALAHRFGYQRSLPTMAWPGAEELAERHAPGALAAARAAYDDRPSTQLRREAVEVVRGSSR